MNSTAIFDRYPATRLSSQPRSTLDAVDLGRRGEPLVFDCPSIWQHELPLLDALRREYGHLRCEELQGTYGWVLRYEQMERFEALNIATLGEFIDLFESGECRRLPYLMHLSIQRNLARLARHFVTPPEFRPNWVTHPSLDRIGGPELFFGQTGTGFGAVHIDHVSVHVGFYQFEGEKQFILFPPEDAPCLYRYPGKQFPFQLRNSRITAATAEDCERFPLLHLTRPRTVTLRAGQALFLPANWWHTTLNTKDSISYSIRIVNRSNAASTVRDYAAGVPRAARRLLKR